MSRDRFEAAVRAAVRECYEIGYAPTRFEQMISVDHPVEVARKFVVSGDFQYGFRELLNMGRNDLTIESIMLQPAFSDLFTQQELDAATWRLANG
ncbi:hypothetical protein [Shewanella waksmanii]|uniref:hypothetical protein n=1 Tax=Shewanella waksmanii TaxID=213783 RepID=UPI003734DB16